MLSDTCEGCGYPVRRLVATGEVLDCVICGDDYNDEIHMETKELTEEEAKERIRAGAHNVMIQRDEPCDDDNCECTEKEPCWYGAQEEYEVEGARRLQLWF